MVMQFIHRRCFVGVNKLYLKTLIYHFDFNLFLLLQKKSSYQNNNNNNRKGMRIFNFNFSLQSFVVAVLLNS